MARKKEPYIIHCTYYEGNEHPYHYSIWCGFRCIEAWCADDMDVIIDHAHTIGATLYFAYADADFNSTNDIHYTDEYIVA